MGTGRLALPLAERGLTVVGVDASAAMLDRLAAKPGATGVTTVLADMADPRPALDAAGAVPPSGFGLVFCAYNTFLNLDSAAAQQRCLGAAAELLAPTGSLVIEAYVPADPDDVPRTSLDVSQVTSDAVVLTCTEHDPEHQVVTGQHVELRNGSVRLRPWRVRYVTPEQLDAMALSVGLELEGRDQDWRGAPFGDDSSVHVSSYRAARLR